METVNSKIRLQTGLLPLPVDVLRELLARRLIILDIEDMRKPRFVSGLDWTPPFTHPIHTTLPVPFPLRGRRMMIVRDEDVAKTEPGPPSFLWLVDITDEAHPVPFATFQVAGIDGTPQPPFTGCHQPCEDVRGTEIPVAWFAHGLRIVESVGNFRHPRWRSPRPGASSP